MSILETFPTRYTPVPGLLERFSVGTVYVSPVMFREEPPGVRQLRAAIEQSGVPLAHLHGGQRLNVGDGVVCEALHPPRRGTLGTVDLYADATRRQYSKRSVKVS